MKYVVKVGVFPLTETGTCSQALMEGFVENTENYAKAIDVWRKLCDYGEVITKE